MLKFSLVVCLTIQLAYTKPWFHDSSYQTEENASDLEETIDTWITKTDRNDRKINIIQNQIEEIGDVLEGQSEMIGKLQDLISFGQRPFDENLMMNGEEEEEEEFMNEPLAMNFENEEEHSDEVEGNEVEEERSDEVEDSEPEEERSDEVKDNKTGEETEDADTEAREENFEDISDTGDEVEPTDLNEQENVTQTNVNVENSETLELQEGK